MARGRARPTGLLDTHFRSGPDVARRKLTDPELAGHATDAGHRAQAIESHHPITAAQPVPLGRTRRG